MNEYDIIVIIILLSSSIFALFRGFIREVFSFVAWIAAAIITFFTYPHMAEVLSTAIKSKDIVNIGSIIITYVIALFVIAGINALLLRALRDLRMGPLDRAMGMLFGLLRGLFIVALIHYAILKIHGQDEPPALLSEARTHSISAIGADIIANFLDKYIDKIREGDTEDLDDAREDAEEFIEEYQPEVMDPDSEFYDPEALEEPLPWESNDDTFDDASF